MDRRTGGTRPARRRMVARPAPSPAPARSGPSTLPYDARMTDEIAIAATTTDPAAARRADLAALAGEEWDVVVVGGGITGAGILLDAVSRGLRAALVEQSDIAAGTSSRSSRLIHGGLRYLEQFHIGLVREALSERARLLDLAPHLVSLARSSSPCTACRSSPAASTARASASTTCSGPPAGAASHATWASRRRASSCRRSGPRGCAAAIVYHDGAEDDARYTLAVARTAAGLGGLPVTRVRADGLVLEGGRAKGIVARDLARRGGPPDPREARHRRHRRLGGPGGQPVRRREDVPSIGSHIMIAARADPDEARDGDPRPRQGGVHRPVAGLLGHRDHGPAVRRAARPPDGEPRRGGPPPGDREHGPRRGPHHGRHRRAPTPACARSSARPRTAGPSRSRASTRWRVDRNGLVRIGGGKYTTYRLMARDAVDAALGPDEAKTRPSATADLPLVGAASRSRPGEPRRPHLEGHGADQRPGDAPRAAARHRGDGGRGARPAARPPPPARRGPAVPARPRSSGPRTARWRLTLDDVLARRFRLAMELRGSRRVDRAARRRPARRGARLGRRPPGGRGGGVPRRRAPRVRRPGTRHAGRADAAIPAVAVAADAAASTAVDAGMGPVEPAGA